MRQGGNRLTTIGGMYVNYIPITTVGIDVSKHKSTVAVRRRRWEDVKLPFDVHHNAVDMQNAKREIAHE